jgi:hypothetical protein
LGAFVLFKTVENFPFIRFTLTDELNVWDLSTMLIFGELIYLYTTLICLWKKKNLGRVLLIFWASVNIISSIVLFISLIATPKLDSSLLYWIIPANPMTILFGVLFNFSLVYFMYEQNIKQLFKRK